VLELICRDPVKAASITAAALFQSVGSGRSTLLIDEADSIFASNGDRNEDLRGVLNAGNVPGSPVIRGGRDGKPVRYDVFCPKVIAGIATGKLPDTVRDRAIVCPIDRKLKSERVERLKRHRLKAELEDLRSRLSAWAEANQGQLFNYDLPEPLEKISDRLEQAWEPLIAIAELAGGQYPEKARAAAEDLAGEDDENTTASHALLMALKDVFGNRHSMHTKDIVAALNDDKELTFGPWNDDKGIKPTEIARLLRRYRIKPRKVNIAGTHLQGYQQEQFKTVWGRYGGDLGGTSGTSQRLSGFSEVRETEPGSKSSCSEQGQNPRPIREVPWVPGKSGDTRTEDDPDGRYADELERLEHCLGDDR
jgi:Protein of unknown function (DUF3631)